MCVPITCVYRTDSGNATTNLSIRQKENMPVDSKTLDTKVAVTFKIVFNWLLNRARYFLVKKLLVIWNI